MCKNKKFTNGFQVDSPAGLAQCEVLYLGRHVPERAEEAAQRNYQRNIQVGLK